MKILLIEDDHVTGMLLELHLNNRGHQVLLATTVQTALAILEAQMQSFDAVVSDNCLPDGLGLHILQYMDGIPSRPRTLLHSSSKTFRYNGEYILLDDAVEIFEFAEFHLKSPNRRYIDLFLESVAKE